MQKCKLSTQFGDNFGIGFMEIRHLENWTACVYCTRCWALRLYMPLARKPGWRFTARIQVSSNRLVKNWCKWVRKMKISQNHWIQLTPEQFSPSGRSRPIQKCGRCVWLCVLEKSVLENRFSYDTKKVEIFMKSARSKRVAHFGRPCRGLRHLERCFAPKDVFHMTRRAFPALRVIQRQGKSRSRMLVNNLGR